MDIIVHRKSAINAMKASAYLQNMFTKLTAQGLFMRVSHNGGIIDIYDVRIHFRCGDVNRMAGMRPDYYNVDTYEADCFLMQSVNKCNGRCKYSLDGIHDVVVKHINESTNNYTDMHPTDIRREMRTIRDSERDKAFIFRPEEWVWEISRDVREKLDRPCIVMDISVRTIPYKTNYFKLVRREEKGEKNMSLYDDNVVTIRRVDGTEINAYVRTIISRPGEATRIELDLVDPETIKTREMLYGVDLSRHVPQIKDVKFECPATIVFWADGTKTVVRAQGEAYDPEKGLAMAISRKVMGNKRDYYHVFLKCLKKFRKQENTPKSTAEALYGREWEDED